MQQHPIQPKRLSQSFNGCLGRAIRRCADKPIKPVMLDILTTCASADFSKGCMACSHKARPRNSNLRCVPSLQCYAYQSFFASNTSILISKSIRPVHGDFIGQCSHAFFSVTSAIYMDSLTSVSVRVSFLKHVWVIILVRIAPTFSKCL